MNNEDFWMSINIGAADNFPLIPRLFHHAGHKGLDILTVRHCKDAL